ncbi:MAG: hypothetical protein K5696_02465 [Lachnospiraceae bacterium]|nr:hypothetical protein [Lachnospiraceae bacterium]
MKAVGTEMDIRRVFKGETIDRLRAALFYAALTIEILVVLVDKSELHNPYESGIFRATFVLTLAAVLIGRYTRREWAVIALAFLFGIFCWRMTGRNEILRTLVFVTAAGGRSGQVMMKTAFFETAAGCVLIAMLSVMGIFGAQTVDSAVRMNEAASVRYCLGFGHPNALHCMFFMLLCMAMLSWGCRFRPVHYLLFLAADIGLWLLTDSRTGVMVTALLLLMGLLCTYREGAPAKQRWPYIAGFATVAGCVAFSVWCAAVSFAVGYRHNASLSRVVVFLDEKLNSRIAELYWASEHADLTTWRLFSGHGAERYFDMGWCRLFYWYGIVPGALAVVMVLLLVVRSGRRRDGIMLAVIVALSVYTVVEAHLVSVYIGRNFLLLVFGTCWGELLHVDRQDRVALPSAFLRRESKT